jgi:diguanylate cyclase
LITGIGGCDALSPLATLAATHGITDMLLRYGLDARSRSALHASFRHDDDAAALDRRLDAVNAALADTDPHATADTQALRHFLETFVALPEADFAADWLEQLDAAWHRLRQAGCADDLPLRAAQALVGYGSRHLLGERSSLSALEVEILTALSAAGMCVADFLNRMAKQGVAATVADDTADPGHGRVLARRLAEALDQARNAQPGRAKNIVGLIAFQFHLGPSALTLDREQRDALAEAAVERIAVQLRERDVLVRTETHSGAIILPELLTPAQMRLAVNKVAQVLDRPLFVQGSAVRSPFAIGAVWSPDHGDSVDDLMRCADLAVETAWREGKPIVFFDDRLLATARREALIEKEFAGALENGRLSIHVQPQVDLRSGRCVGGELLLRWTTTEGYEVPPWQVPDVAQRLGLAPQLTRWLVFGACRILAELIKAGTDIQLSVNLMARDVMDQELPQLVEQAIKVWRVPPAKLTFELIESAVLEDPETGAGVMNRLIDLGAMTSIDDFGVGYSSILYLRQLPLHELKIDRAFVDTMLRSPQDKEIVVTLIRLAHGLGLHVVAEGVENEETLHLLREQGCDRAQGYWISRAMPTAEMPAWVDAWNRRQG